MKCFFETCEKAIENALKSKSYGCYYSESKTQNPDVHIHNCCEIFLCISGDGSFLIDDNLYTVSDGDLFVINQFEAHKVAPNKQGRFVRYIMHVHPDFLSENSLNNVSLSNHFYSSEKETKLHLPEDKVLKLVSLFESLNQEYDYGDELYKKIHAIELLLEVSELFSSYKNDSLCEPGHKTVQLAIDYINCHYASDLTLETVAKNVFISPNQLSRLFNRYCGTTVNKYIVSKRVCEAKKLLSKGYSVTETALLCGFNDYANFIRVFKNIVGITPGKYKLNEIG